MNLQAGMKNAADGRGTNATAGHDSGAAPTGAPPDAVATLAAVEHRYGATLALAGVDLAIPARRMVGFIGPDGVGKSSLLALVAGARVVQAGSVTVLGGDIADRAHRAVTCPRIAYMPQGLGKNLYPTLSVRENLDFFARLFGLGGAARDAKIAELLAATGLDPFPDRPAGKLSGGMKQKLSLCCSLIHDPDLLILDEPTTGVDPLSRRQFWELIDRMRARRPQMSVLVATAYFDEAERFDELVAMDAGRILAQATPAELKARTGASSLEQAFVQLLPPERRGRGGVFTVPPRAAGADDAVAIEAEGLTRRFGDFTAVDHVSFRIPRGEIFGFLGSNGCGKTTTMKMLTGLLPATEGSARLFGREVDANDLATRKRVGFMSQAFSLYSELTVRQNLALHARLFALPRARVASRLAELEAGFGLGPYMDQVAEALPLGVRQRLSLAVAVIHEPELLILDEPTSGVDPVARDGFWELLVELSRERGTTIFISTHFMNEAERCDRISLMHAGRVLTQGTPAGIVRASGQATLEDAFIAALEAAAGGADKSTARTATGATDTPAPAGREAATTTSAAPPASTTSTTDAGRATATADSAPPDTHTRPAAFSPRRLWAYARREATELRRDTIRLAFALLGPLLLMTVFGYGITFDVEGLSYATLDRDGSPESRLYLEGFASSRYFRDAGAVPDAGALDDALRRGRVKLTIEIAPGFGRELRQGRAPEVQVAIDGSMPFRAETSRGYVEGVHRAFIQRIAADNGISTAQPFSVEERFRYNQDFRSVYAMVPGIVMLLLMLIPPMMTALGIVREKELGSIINFYVTPTSGIEFLVGKQLPYIGLALLNFASLSALALLLFQVPFKGDPLAYVLGGLLYVTATTAFGMFVSCFVGSQIAAIFATAILAVMPTVQFSGFLMPVASLSPDGWLIGRVFPSTWFQHISVGSFTKALEPRALLLDFAMLALLALGYIGAARLALRTQEK
ncbi:ribosome-associated ATPase/putative transporter RbbA [Derxia gummosa]|uniref:Ribosome-associated ATPase/putative transporter RbbA n=1 Tax=Derxia gummosa DSM 723 TaxID=1121388 RepID=A0A9U5G0E2_9BURK|nr:ribosome-associated ATPase/putative transporter RbbA [Derxia gummosa]